MKEQLTEMYETLHTEPPSERMIDNYMVAAVKASLIGMTREEVEEAGYDPEKVKLSVRDIAALFGLSDCTINQSETRAREVLGYRLRKVQQELEAA